MTARKGKSKFQWVKLLQKGDLAEIRLNRPESLNAFHVYLAADLGLALKEVSKDKGIRAVILRGEGRAFSAGGDLKMFRELLPRARRSFRKLSPPCHQRIKTNAPM